MDQSFQLSGRLFDRDSWTAAQWCSMERSLGLIGTRSAMTLLREAFYGATRFDDLVRRAGVTPAVGAQRLRDMVAHGLLERQPYREPGQRTRYAYTITPLGLEVFPVIAALTRLGDQLPDPRENAILLTHAGCGEPIRAEVRCGRGHVVRPADVVVSVVDERDSTPPDQGSGGATKHESQGGD